MEFEDDFFFEEDKILTNSLLSHSDAIAPNYLNGVKEDIITALIAVLRPSIELRQLTMMEDRIDSPDIELVARDQIPAATQLHHYQLGMTITSGNVIIQKDSTNLIGISIGGGAPLCPCLYIVQVFDNTPAATEGTLQSGDELVAVNGASVKGKTKVEVAKMIQVCDGQVSINYNKLHADPRQGRSLDIALKKILSPLQSILWPLVQIAIDKDPSSAALLLNCPTKPVATAIFSALEICIRTNPKNAAVTFGISYE